MNDSSVQHTDNRLLDRLDAEREQDEAGRDWADWWDKREEPQVEGTVIDRRELDPEDDRDPFAVIELRRTDGSRASIGASAYQLREDVRRKDPQIGDRMAVVFHGNRDIGGGKTVGEYTLIVEHGDGPFAPQTTPTDTSDFESIGATQAANEAEREKRDEDIPF